MHSISLIFLYNALSVHKLLLFYSAYQFFPFVLGLAFLLYFLSYLKHYSSLELCTVYRVAYCIHFCVHASRLFMIWGFIIHSMIFPPSSHLYPAKELIISVGRNCRMVSIEGRPHFLVLPFQSEPLLFSDERWAMLHVLQPESN